MLTGCLVWLLPVLACSSGETGTSWAGTVDTLPTGVIQVSNPETGVWDEASSWVVTEEMRIGAADGDGPDLFGRITDLAVDPAGRIYVFDGQAQELRIFGRDGLHIRTVGRKGGGPGEFEQVIGMDWSPNGDLWLVDPSNNRISVIDTSGTYVTSHPALGGIVVLPWPGGFDDRGSFYNYGLDPNPGDEDFFPLVFIRFDDEMTPVDTAQVPRYQGEQDFFERRDGGNFMRASVPHSPSLTWRFTRTGDFWFALTGEYQIVQRTFAGDTVRIVSKDFTPVPVTSEDIEEARENLEWFTRQGGEIDLSRIPATKPALRGFFFDADGNIWVEPVVAAEQQGRVFELFDPDGRFLGEILLPFELRTSPVPVFMGDYMYAVTRDELDVPYVVKARLGRPATDTGDLTIGVEDR